MPHVPAITSNFHKLLQPNNWSMVYFFYFLVPSSSLPPRVLSRDSACFAVCTAQPLVTLLGRVGLLVARHHLTMQSQTGIATSHKVGYLMPSTNGAYYSPLGVG